MYSEAFGADKGEEVGASNGLKDCDDEECEDVEDDQAEKAGAAMSLAWGASNKYTFCKVSQLGFRISCFHKVLRMLMHVLSQAFANMLSQKYLGTASLHKYDFAGFSKL